MSNNRNTLFQTLFHTLFISLGISLHIHFSTLCHADSLAPIHYPPHSLLGVLQRGVPQVMRGPLGLNP